MSLLSKILVWIGLLFVAAVWIVTSWITGQPVPPMSLQATGGNVVDQKTVITLIVGVIVPFLALVFKAYAFGDPTKLWIEFVLSIVGGVVVLFVTGALPALPPANEPVAFFTALAPILTAVFTVAVLIYEALQAQLTAKVLQIRASRGK